MSQRDSSKQAESSLAPAELATWRSLIDTTADLRRLLGSELQALGVSPGEYAVLLALTEAEGRRLRSSELASLIDWERSRLSHQLRRMENRGLVRRAECETDSRGAVVAVTDEGVDALRTASKPHLRAVKRYFVDALTAEQIDALADILSAVRGHLHEVTNEPSGRSAS